MAVTDVLALNQLIREGAFAGYTTGVNATLVTGQTINDALTNISSDILTLDLTTIMVEITNVGGGGGVALDQFEIHGSIDGTTFWTFYDGTGTEYTVPTGILIATSGELKVLASGSSHWFILDCNGIHSIRLKAGGNAGTTTLTVKYSGR